MCQKRYAYMKDSCSAQLHFTMKEHIGTDALHTHTLECRSDAFIGRNNSCKCKTTECFSQTHTFVCVRHKILICSMYMFKLNRAACRTNVHWHVHSLAASVNSDAIHTHTYTHTRATSKSVSFNDESETVFFFVYIFLSSAAIMSICKCSLGKICDRPKITLVWANIWAGKYLARSTKTNDEIKTDILPLCLWIKIRHENQWSASKAKTIPCRIK